MSGMGRAGSGGMKYFVHCNCCRADSSQQELGFPTIPSPSHQWEVPVWPPAAGQLSRGGEVEGAAQAQLELL